MATNRAESRGKTNFRANHKAWFVAVGDGSLQGENADGSIEPCVGIDENRA